eukprot:924042-Prymnesium_polylepis.1
MGETLTPGSQPSLIAASMAFRSTWCSLDGAPIICILFVPIVRMHISGTLTDGRSETLVKKKVPESMGFRETSEATKSSRPQRAAPCSISIIRRRQATALSPFECHGCPFSTNRAASPRSFSELTPSGQATVMASRMASSMPAAGWMMWMVFQPLSVMAATPSLCLLYSKDCSAPMADVGREPDGDARGEGALRAALLGESRKTCVTCAREYEYVSVNTLPDAQDGTAPHQVRPARIPWSV